MTTPVFTQGYWTWIVPAFGAVSGETALGDAQAVGAFGVIVHDVGTITNALAWITRHGATLTGAGLQIGIAIGSMGKDPWEKHMADPTIASVKAGYHTIIDCESAWDKPGGRASAVKVVDKVLAPPPVGAGPGALGMVADCAWWKPSVHSGFPIQEFGVLCLTRYPQCYPEVFNGLQHDGAAALCLATARTQYTERGTPAANVYATVRGYVRSTNDAANFALQEPHHLVYTGSAPGKPNRVTPEVIRGMQAATKMRAAGYATVKAFQAANGLVADGIVGKKTLARLGVT